jgi:hypothetical protein
MPDQRAAEYRQKAEECRSEARHAFKEADMAACSKWPGEWLKLAQTVEEAIAYAPSVRDSEARLPN